MTDREKVEKGLNICTSAEPCNGCPYLGERNCSLAMVRDALDLLKEQQNQIWEFQDQVEYLTDKQKVHETTDTNDLRIFHCKKCGYGIEDIFISDEHNYTLVPKFCPNCGRSVNNWNDL